MGSTESKPAGRRIRGLDAAERREQRRALLLDAALELFAENGFHNTSIEQICQTAYVGTKSFYEVFDSREACYIELLHRVSDRIGATMAAVLEDAPADDSKAGGVLVTAFAHALVDDPRLARVTFGEAPGISRAVERQRRSNRRWAAGFLVSVWERYGALPKRRGVDYHRVAVGAIGGMFDLVSDWLLDADPGKPSDVEELIKDLTAFYEVVRAGVRR